MTHGAYAPVLVVDFGAQYAQLIARRVREARVYSEIVPHTMSVAEMMTKRPAAIILSGGPSSVYADGAPTVDPELFRLGVPTFGICYGFQAQAVALGGAVAQTGLAEFGRTALSVTSSDSTLFRDLPVEQSVWMSHGDSVSAAPEGFVVTACSDGAEVAAFEHLGAAARRGAVPPGGPAHRARSGRPRALPLRDRRHRADVDDDKRHR